MGNLRINDLVVEYSNVEQPIRVIDGLDLDVSAGSLVVLLGPSGCGKTSLLSCIGGILSPTNGRIQVGDIDVTALSDRKLTGYRRSTVGIVFQSFNLVASLTARENVMVPLWVAGWSMRAARRRADELLTRVGLQDRTTHRPRDLSGGQQARVALARAIALDPPLILADEPTAHLDHVQAEEVLRLLRELAVDERIVMVASHDNRILPFADRVVSLTAGSAPFDREPETVRLSSGSVLFEQGSTGDLIYVVAGGELEVTRESTDGAQELLKVVTPGEYVGEIGPMLQLARSATVRARTDATVTGYTVQAFRRLLGAAPEQRFIEHQEIDINRIKQGRAVDDCVGSGDAAHLVAPLMPGSQTSAADRRHVGRAEDNTTPTSSTLVELLQQQTVGYRDKVAFSFSRDGEDGHADRLTYHGLDIHARRIASSLMEQGATAGERVLVLCPPGLDFVAGLFGCLYAGAVAVPVHPPLREHLVPRVASIVADVEPGFALTTSELRVKVKSTIDSLVDGRQLRWCDADMSGGDGDRWVGPDVDADAAAIVQYTSGSTSAPKGVVLTHRNLLHNSEAIRQAWHGDENAIGMFWLPPHHDMGLIGGILGTLYVGCTSVLMPPTAFVKRPMRWLEAISRHRATISAAPNFAYDMCVELSNAQERAALDLSSWSTAMCGAEPVRAATLDGFAEAFAPAGFRREAFYPVYGMAEATLLISGGSDSDMPVIRHIDSIALREDRVVDVAPEHSTATSVVGCGRPRGDQQVIIVNPETRQPREANQVGEIWVAGPSVAQGYWERPEQTEDTFSAVLSESQGGPFMRTGDLGFLHSGELFITGRRKDLIIIRGANHYPNDIELTVQDCHPALLRGRGAAFAATRESGVEQLVVVQEVDRNRIGEVELAEIVHTIRAAITERHAISAHAVVLVEPLRIPTTSSGKIQRSACRQQFLDGNFEMVAQWYAPTSRAAYSVGPEPESDVRSAAQIADRLASLLTSELGVSSTEIDFSQPFAYYGLDSIRAVRITAALEEWLGRELAPTLAYEYPTIARLSAHLAQTSPTDHAAATPATDRTHVGVADEPIAIVGIGCRFPGADGPAAFWRLLTDGADAISEVPPDRWDTEAFYDHDPSVPGTTVSRHGGFVRDTDQFDFEFFGISPRESAQMDPQQRLLLEAAWEALEDAGQVPDQLAGSRTGVFVGISTNDYGYLRLGQPQLIDAYTGTGNAASISANRISYFFDFRGPSMAIDTACSSSLVAVHQACRSLRDDECTLALAGGVNLILSPALMINFTKAGLMAPDGRCKTFDAGADGFVRGEGAGIVVLKPLGRALADNDPIYAVIRGTATNQDGRTNGLMAPSRQSQEAVLAEAYRRAGLSPGAVQYIEAHGTGTLLGDAIEATALGTVLAEGRPPGSPCLVGSTKTNIGHLEAAAGVAGLIKVALALRHRAIPPSLNFADPNPNIPFDRLPLQVAQILTRWPENGGRAIAGVSSFGFGGTNAHAVLTEAPQVRTIPAENGTAAARADLLPLSARSGKALTALAGRYEAALATGMPLADLCYTAGARRGHYEHRLCVVGDSPTKMAESLAAYRQGQSRPGLSVGRCRPGGHRPEVIFAFSGQGSQWHGMGQRLRAEEPVFREAFDACERAMSPYLDGSVLADLTSAQYADIGVVQPAIFAVQVALAALWRSWGVEPAAVVAHSLGEAAAAHIAGALSLNDAARVICTRALLLRRVRGRGAMVVAEVSFAEAQELLAGRESHVSVAAINSCRSTVLSGDRAVLADLVSTLEQQNRFCRWIDVDVASHSPQMDELRADLRDMLAELQPIVPSIPIYSTVTGDLLADRLLDADYWVEHLRSPVRFSTALRRLLDRGHDTVLEISPHPILLSSVHEDADDLGQNCTLLPSMRRDDGGRATALATLGTLHTLGHPVTWAQLYRPGSQCIPAPNYPWQRVYSGLGDATPVVPITNRPRRNTADAPTTAAPDPRDQLYQPRWQPASIPPGADRPSKPKEAGSWLIFSDGGVTADTLCDYLESHSETCVLVDPSVEYERRTPHSYRLDPAQPDHFRRLIEDAFGDGLPPCRGVVHLWALLAASANDTSIDSLESATTHGAISVLHLVQALPLADWSAVPRLWLVTSGAQVADAGAEAVSIAQAPMWAMGRTIDHEYPELRCTRVDLSARGGSDELRALFQEVWTDDLEVDVALRGSRRYVARLERYSGGEPAETPVGTATFKAHGTYLITGGLGALGCVVATWMVEQGARHLVLMGRGAASAAAQESLDTLRAAGVEVMVAHADVTKADEVATVLESIDASMPPLRGVIHAAGIIDDGILQRLDEQQLRAVMAPKVQGAWNLHTLTRNADLHCFVLFSSAASLLGSPGASNYAAANAFLDALAWQRKAEGRVALSIDWGPWAGLGFSTRSQGPGRFARHGVQAMPATECLRALTYLLARDATQVAVLDVDWERWQNGLRPVMNPHPPSDRNGATAEVDTERDTTRGSGSSLYDELQCATTEERRQLLESYLRDLAAAKLGQAPSNLDIHSPLSYLGVDSLITLEVRMQVERDLGIVVPMARLLDGPSVVSLSGWLGEQLSETGTTPIGTPATQSDEAPAPKPAGQKTDAAASREIDLLTQIPELSDDTVTELLQKVIAEREFAMKESCDDE